MTKQVAEQLYVSVWLTCEEVEEVMLSYEGRPVIGGDVHIHQYAQHLHKQVTVNVRSLHSPHHSLRLSMHSCLFFHMENPKVFLPNTICGYATHLNPARSTGLLLLTLASCI